MQLIFPTSGQARIFGRPAGDLEVKRRLGFLPENPLVLRLPHRRGAARLLRPAVRHAGARAAGARSPRCSTQVGIGKERRLRLRSYSKGMVQRVGIAQAILNRPGDRVLRRADVGARSARPARRPSADARPARSRLHGVLQLAHPVGRRDAVQPGGHRRPGPAGRRRPAVGAAGVRDQGLGAGRSTGVSEPALAALRTRARHLVALDAAATPSNCRPIRPTRCCASWRPPGRRCCRSIRYATPSSRSSSSTSPPPPRATTSQL